MSLELVTPGLPPPLGANGLPLKPEWVEMAHELSSNMCRHAVFYNGTTFGCLQVRGLNEISSD